MAVWLSKQMRARQKEPPPPLPSLTQAGPGPLDLALARLRRHPRTVTSASGARPLSLRLAGFSASSRALLFSSSSVFVLGWSGQTSLPQAVRLSLALQLGRLAACSTRCVFITSILSPCLCSEPEHLSLSAEFLIPRSGWERGRWEPCG